MGSHSVDLQHAVIERLRDVIDPETNVDVIRMRLIEDLEVNAETGSVSYRFRPSSPFCPLAVHLVLKVREAVAEVPGVADQKIEVVGYVGADGLNTLLADNK